MGANGLTPAPVVSRLRDARDHARWAPDPGYSIVRDALFDQDPERVAILRPGVHQPEAVTFGEIQQTVRRVAGALRERGVGRGDRVAMYLDPSQAAAEVGVRGACCRCGDSSDPQAVGRALGHASPA
jgi:Long-chain acyl-CoA synthetases (AMP-forming)